MNLTEKTDVPQRYTGGGPRLLPREQGYNERKPIIPLPTNAKEPSNALSVFMGNFSIGFVGLTFSTRCSMKATSYEELQIIRNA